MKFHVLTLFPEMVMQGLHTSILGRAAENGQITMEAVNIRDFTTNKHNRVDDYTYGGGAGMLIQAQPVYDAWKNITGNSNVENKKIRTLYMTPQGIPFTQTMAEELAKEDELVFLCGHYEGIDERVLEEIVTDYVSIGDYVLTGGELPAMVMIDAIARLVPGVLNNEVSAETESFHGNLLEYPQYSRPVSWMGKEVPAVLLSGDHKKINAWRMEESVKRTKERRPDLYKLYERDQACINQLMRNKLHHIDMIELLKRGQGQILYFEKDGCLLRDKASGCFMMTASDSASAEKILNLCIDEIWFLSKNNGNFLFISHQAFINPIVGELLGMESFLECYQTVYTRKEMLPVPRVTIKDGDMESTVTIKPLTMEHFCVVCDNYKMAGEEYIKNRITHGAMYGAFAGEILTGFCGIHMEGAGGMLEVLPKYRRMGIGTFLETALINLQLEKGFIPYFQVGSENEASSSMQRALGLYFSKEKVWWLEKSQKNAK